jgi:hypothetical protein
MKFLPRAVISQEHGKIYKRRGQVYFVMYHPAVALYKGSMRDVLLADFKILRRFLDGEVEPESLEDTVSSIMAEKKQVSESGTHAYGSANEDQFGMGLRT